ncbi:unnamed protein product, partial [Musa banksii]
NVLVWGKKPFLLAVDVTTLWWVSNVMCWALIGRSTDKLTQSCPTRCSPLVLSVPQAPLVP